MSSSEQGSGQQSNPQLSSVEAAVKQLSDPELASHALHIALAKLEDFDREQDLKQKEQLLYEAYLFKQLAVRIRMSGVK